MTFMQKEQNPYDEVSKIFDKLFQYIPDIPPSKDEKKKDIIELFDSTVFLDDFAPLVEEVKCPVCLQVSLQSWQCSKCRGIVCQKCDDENQYALCPLCHQYFLKEELDRVLKNVMGHMLIRCDNCKQYGNKIVKIKLSENKYHLQICEYSNYQCLTCNQKILHSKKNCIEHALACGYSDVTCNFCNKKLKLYFKNSHEKKCANEKIKCNFCNKEITRKNYSYHINEGCEYRKILCKVCNTEFIFKEGHTREKCQEIQIQKLKVQSKELFSILKKHKDKIDLTEEERSSINNIENEIKEPEFNPFGPKIEPEIKFKDKILKSSIIKKEEDITYLINLFKQEIKNINLIYKMTSDGENAFHAKCDNIAQTLSLIKIRVKNNSFEKPKIYKYGGYTKEKWDISNTVKKDDNSFIFSFSNKSEPFFMKESKDNSFFSIICSQEFGPSFGFTNKKPELWIKGEKGGYDNTLAFGDEKRICTGGAKVFDVVEIEVYQIIFE